MVVRSAKIDTQSVPQATHLYGALTGSSPALYNFFRTTPAFLPLRCSLRLHTFNVLNKAQPTVVFFGDNIPRPRVEETYRMVDESNLLVVAGSSLQVLWCNHRCCLVSSRACATIVVTELRVIVMLPCFVKPLVPEIPGADAVLVSLSSSTSWALG